MRCRRDGLAKPPARVRSLADRAPNAVGYEQQASRQNRDYRPYELETVWIGLESGLVRNGTRSDGGLPEVAWLNCFLVFVLEIAA